MADQKPNPPAAPSHSTRDLEILTAVAESLNSAADLRGALQRTLSLVTSLFGLNTGWVWLRDPDTGHFYSAAALNLPPFLREPVRMTGKPCWCIKNFQHGVLTPKNIDVLECSRLSGAVAAGKVDATEGLRYHASVPLYFRQKPLGIMNLTGPDYRSLTKDELRLLSVISSQVGAAIERIRLAEASTGVARVEERIRFSREIHDTLAQGLTAIGLTIEAAIHQLESDPERARERLERALGMTRENLEEARRSVENLRSEALSRPLSEALDALARRFASETGVRVQVHSLDAPQLPLRTEAELYRIAQEALANIRQHAQASEAEISLKRRASSIVLTVKDRGRGFETGVKREGHHGLTGMRERARLLGGHLRVTSNSESGTVVTATVPLPRDTGS
jgi:two-component system NarL family sensor kinase